MASQEAQQAGEHRAAMSRRFVLGAVAGAGAAIHCDGWDRAVTGNGGEVASSHWSQ